MDFFIAAMFGVAVGLVAGYLYGSKIVGEVQAEVSRLKADIEKLRDLKL